MRSEIKQRIEQIKRGEVPQGYKKTKIGIVPEEWEETKLSKYFSVRNEKNEDLKYDKTDVFSISGELGIVNQIALLGRSYAGASVAPYGIVYPNDVVYTKSPLKANPYGIIKTNLSDSTGIVSTLYAVYSCKENVCPKFVQDYFSWDNRLNNYLYPIVNIGAKHDMKISDENALKGIVVFPPLDEQKKIVEILACQDKLIELNKRKVEELKRLKKAYLSKMFPKKGCDVPELRFKGFTSPWEQRKLGDVISVGNGMDYKSLNEGNIPVYGTGGYMLSVDKALSYEKDAIGIGRKGTIDKPYILKAPFWTVDTLFYCIPLENYDLGFVFGIFQNIDWKQKDESTGVPSLSKASINSVTITTPSFEEQQRIGQFFTNLDNLITLHQRKVEELQSEKKSLMQLLLTGIVRV